MDIRELMNEPGSRYYKAGVDRGVYFDRYGRGHPWIGLASVEETPSGGSSISHFIDGEKYAIISEFEDFEATINAFNTPSQFLESDGYGELSPGLFLGQQPRASFGFSYRTFVGNDIDGLHHAYQLHVVYHAVAAPTSMAYGTLTNTTDPVLGSWKFTTLPQKFPGRKSTAHIFVDSRYADPGKLATFEDQLYGTPGIDSELPTPEDVIAIFE